MLRRRCDSDCMLAPYFPGDEAEKFFGVHKVFGASNVIRMIQVEHHIYLSSSLAMKLLVILTSLSFLEEHSLF
ncbi:LOB domain-containing protein [Populus alba x Populus x berolinensis]|uniref:LOB domain-containing protein n=1 Tax=Populus alba x Populus x berolinensis TaxID=444605 RepID=A0AAD6PZM6_9ROSI|nr:LOB domain-containing protein [Populus alba x Populus x berolinensis]KAJ6973461.1 LOB domain-containing protein [Populus alba x Populus x berolinensis]